MKIIVSEACDGFTIILKPKDPTLPVVHYWFSQEDSKEDLVSVFNRIGFESEYEEDY